MSPRRHTRGTSRTARPSGHRRDAVDQVEGLGDVVDVGCGRDGVERRSLTVADQAFAGHQRAAQWRGSPYDTGRGRQQPRCGAVRRMSATPGLAGHGQFSVRCEHGPRPAGCTVLRRGRTTYRAPHSPSTLGHNFLGRSAVALFIISDRCAINGRCPGAPLGCAPPTPQQTALPATSSGSPCGRGGSPPRCGTC